MVYETGIETCCSGMQTMLKDGTIRPYVTKNSDTGEMYVRGNNGVIHNYNQVKYCSFCGSGIKVIDRLV